MLEPLAVTVGLVVLNLALYSAYNKRTKALDAGLLLDIVLLRKGVEHTLVELNKVAALVGLALLGLPYLPFAWIFINPLRRGELITHAAFILWSHTCYSLYKYYGSKNIPAVTISYFGDFVKDNGVVRMRKLSLLVGLMVQTISTCWFFEWAPLSSTLIASANLFGFMHFYTMEVDYKGKLGVRPFGFLPFVTAALSVAFVWLL